MCFSCWLNLDFLWSFFGPVCIIITVSDMGGYHCWRKSPENSLFIEKKSDVFQINIFFFIITVWKLAQKFSSLNPDLNSLQKIRWVDTNSQAACAWLLNVCVRARARELFLYNCLSRGHKHCSCSSLQVEQVYLFCPLQGICHHCSGPAVCVGHHVDIWLFPVWRKHNNHVLPIHNLWKPSRGHALCHALSVFQTGGLQSSF